MRSSVCRWSAQRHRHIEDRDLLTAIANAWGSAFHESKPSRQPGFPPRGKKSHRENVEPGPPPVFIDRSEKKWSGSYRLDRFLYRLNKSCAQFGTDGVIMRKRLFQLGVGFRQPDYWQRHRPLCRSVLTCSHGMT